MTKISELQVGQGSVEVEATVKELEETKTFNKFGKDLKVRNAVVEDDSASVKLTLWNDDVDKYNVGDKIKITNGYVNEFQGEKQLTAGKFGKIEKVGAGEADVATDSTTTAEESSLEKTSEKPDSEEAAGLADTSNPEVAKEEVEEAVKEGEI